jgi:hypothetical protein
MPSVGCLTAIDASDVKLGSVTDGEHSLARIPRIKRLFERAYDESWVEFSILWGIETRKHGR